MLTETAKYCSTLKRPLMRGDWERVCGKLFCIALKPPNPDLNDLATTLKRGEGVEMSKLDIEKLPRLTKQVFFGECLNYFCP